MMTGTRKKPLLYTFQSYWEDIQFFRQASSLDELKEYRKEKYYPEPVKSTVYPKHEKLYDALEERFPGLFLMENGGMVPYRGNGFIGRDKAFNVYSRGGVFTITIYDLPEPECSLEETLDRGYDEYYYGANLHNAPFMSYVGSAPSEHYWDGQDIEQWEKIVGTIEPHPYLYEFNSVELDHDSVIKDEYGEIQYPVIWTKGIPGSHRIAYAWGHTPQQAFENLCDEHYNPETYRIDRQHASPDAINANEDTRPTPSTVPDFYEVAKNPLW